MTTRRLEVLPDEHAQPILELVAAARETSTPPGDASAWEAAESGQAKIRTGYKAARRTASAGQYAAHAVRFAALTADPEPWTAPLIDADAGAIINGWDWDQRMQLALDLRRQYKELPKPWPATAVPVSYVATWLTHASGPDLIPATARLAEHVLNSPHPRSFLHDAWYATHGRRLLAALVPDPTDRRSGRPTAELAAHREQLKFAVRCIATTSTMSRTELAASAGITRATLRPWLAEA